MTIPWHAEFADALQHARSGNRPLLVDFFSPQ